MNLKRWLRYQYVWVVFAAIISSLSFTPLFDFCAYGEGELKKPPSEALDVVLLLDSSGSMLHTDPKRLRDQGAKLLLQYLKDGDRLAIAEFSNAASIIRPLSPFEKGKIDEISVQIGKISTEGTYTNILSGVKLAKSLLDEKPREGATQIIVLLSDGKMEPDPTAGTPTSLTNELLNGYLPELKAKGVKVYTLAFSNEADKELLASIALATEGITWFTETADKIHQSYADLFLAVKKPQIVPLTSKGFHVDENVDEATFYVSRPQGEPLEIRSPHGNKVSDAQHGSNVRWFKGDKFDVVTVATPEVGDWQVVGMQPEEGFATVLTKLKLVSDWPAVLYAEEGNLLQVRLFDGEKPVVLPEVSGATKFAFQIIPTDQVSAPIIREFLSDDGRNGDKEASDGIFSARVTLDQPGEYKLRIVAQGPTFTRNQQIPFRVKPPLISLGVETREEEHEVTSHGGEGGGQGGGEDAASSSKSENAHQGGESKSEGEETIKENSGSANSENDSEEGKGLKVQGKKGDYFVFTLSDDAVGLKNLEIKCIAIDAQQHRLALPPPKRSEEKGAVRFELPARVLPQPGIYRIQGFITGVSKTRKIIKGKTRELVYNRPEIKGEEAGVVVVAEVKKEKPKTNYLLGILIVLVLNGGSGFAALTFIKKGAGGAGVASFNFEPVDAIERLLEELRQRAALVEVDFNDPLFTDPNYKLVTGQGGASEPSDTTSQEAAPEPSDNPGEEQG